MRILDTENTILDGKSDKEFTSTESEPKEEKEQDKFDKSKPNLNDKPWQTLVSYVDELTVGGRRNSKGHFVDGMGNFPGFGKHKAPKVPSNCFPRTVYRR